MNRATSVPAALPARVWPLIEYAGRPVLNIKKKPAPAAERADLAPHNLRHSAAVSMAEGSVSMNEITQFLGHSDPGITYRVYARLSPEYPRKAAAS